MEQEKDNVEPIAWVISKVENTKPRGIMKLTIAQERFNGEHDAKKQCSIDGNYYWYADGIKGTFQEECEEEQIHDCCELTCTSTNNQILIGGSSYKTLTYKCFNTKNPEIETTGNYTVTSEMWTFTCVETGENMKDIFTISEIDKGIKFKLKSRTVGDDFMGKHLLVTLNFTDFSANYQFEMIGS